MKTEETSPGTALTRIASVVLLASAVAFLTFATAAIVRGGVHVGVDQMVAYYVAPSLLGVSLVFCLRLPPTSRVNVALLIMALGPCTFTAEVAAHLIVEARSQRARAESGPSIADIVESHRASGTRAYPTIPGNVLVDRDASVRVGNTEVHPLSPSPAGVTAVLCSDFGSVVTYESDRFGFNNPDSLWDAAEPQLILVGDSFTHGVCVDGQANVAARLRGGFRAINLGTRGAGPFQSLGMLREYGTFLRPESVVWLYYEGNDLYDLSRERARPWLTDYLDPSHRQSLPELEGALSREYANWIDSLLTVSPCATCPVSAGATAFVWTDLAKLTTLRSLAGFGVLLPEGPEAIDPLPEILARAREDVAAWGGTLYLAYLPAYERYRVVIGEGVRGKRQVLEAARLAGIGIMDLDSVFRATGRPKDLWAHPDGHLNPEGYGVVAASIAARLEQDRQDDP